MELITVFATEHPNMDHVIIWDDGERLVAYGYLHGKVMRTTPLEAIDVGKAKSEAAQAFGVADPTRVRWPKTTAGRW